MNELMTGRTARNVSVWSDSGIILVKIPIICQDFSGWGNRYQVSRRLWIDTSKDGINYKEERFYQGKRLLVRKTGVGIMATMILRRNVMVAIPFFSVSDKGC